MHTQHSASSETFMVTESTEMIHKTSLNIKNNLNIFLTKKQPISNSDNEQFTQVFSKTFIRYYFISPQCMSDPGR